VPEVEHTIEVDAGIDEVWRYVENLENWAPFVIGFQQLQIVDDRRSVWTVRGDLGILSREVELQADITVWEPRDRVEFTITGLTERLEGDGHFLLRMGTATEEGMPDEQASVQDFGVAPSRGRSHRFHRLRASFARFVLRRLTKRQTPPPPTPARAATTESGTNGSILTFKLRISPGGPMAPMLELLMGPMLEPAAEDLAAQIKGAVEA
jgi:carbon monoxide dehydrogenase subunit G